MQQEKNTYYYPIPGYIQTEINKKGFFLYDWIDEKELKASIERDFLRVFDRFGLVIAFILILPTLVMFFGSGFGMALLTYLGLLSVFSILFLGYLFILSLNRSIILRKVSFVIITTKFFRILDNIQPIRGNSLYGGENIQRIGTVFEEELFRSSRVRDTKTKLFAKVSDNLLGSYQHIVPKERDIRINNDNGQIYIIMIVLYTVYLISIGLLYGIGIFLVLILGNIFAFINRKYLLLRKDKIVQISESFEKINDYAENIEQEQKDLLYWIEEAQNNNWVDGLLLKLESAIDDTNHYAESTVSEIKILKQYMSESHYTDMFDFDIFETWVKKEIVTPLEEIEHLLELNLETLISTIEATDKTVKQYETRREQGALLVSQKRLEMKKEEIQLLITQMHHYIQKLKS